MKAIHFFRHSHTYRRMFLHNYMQYAAASLLVLLAAGFFLLGCLLTAADRLLASGGK